MLGALIALCASGWAVYRVNELQSAVLQRDSTPTADQPGVTLDSRAPETVGSAPVPDTVRLPVNGNSSPAPPVAPSSGRAIGERQREAVLANRGDLRVIDLGEPMDADATYFDSGTGEVVDLGERLEP